MLVELEQAFAALAAGRRPDGVRCVILTGAGDKAFVAGADIAAMSGWGPRRPGGSRNWGGGWASGSTGWPYR